MAFSIVGWFFSKPDTAATSSRHAAAVHTSESHSDEPSSPSYLPSGSDVQDLLNQRQQLFARERELQYLTPPIMTDEERDADRRLCALRLTEIRNAKSSGEFPPAMPFAQARPLIERSRVFDIVKQMPKGGALHLHSSSAGRLDWLIEQLLIRPDCHVCWPTDVYNGTVRTHMTGEIRFCGPNYVPNGFMTVSDVLASDPDFGSKLRWMFSLGPEDPRIGDRWGEFNNCFARLGSALSNARLYEEYFADAFKTLAEDGVSYVELRTGFPTLYSDDGKPQPPNHAVTCYLKALDSVRTEYPDFDLRLIVSDWRGSDPTALVNSFHNAVRMQKAHPELIVGYDLVGKEDDSNPTAALFNVLPALRQVCQEEQMEFPVLYLHDGESDWADDENLIDAYLFKARRIGHGLDLVLYPALEDLFREEQIALEVCPISNQILGYVADLRQHPANGYLRRGVPCVLCSDDPLVFGYDGLSYDFWIAYMAWDLDLAGLRQLALNSIDHSARSDEQKAEAHGMFKVRWTEFVAMINRELPEPQGLDCAAPSP